MTTPMGNNPPGHIPYVEHRQSAARDATAYETELATTLEAAFLRGAETLPEIVAALNASWVRPPEGGAWNEARFTALLAELGSPAR
jgi:hypothetical protein